MLIKYTQHVLIDCLFLTLLRILKQTKTDKDRQNTVNINELQEDLQRLYYIAMDNIERIIQAAEDQNRPEGGENLQVDPGDRIICIITQEFLTAKDLEFS